jgi:hypothetical protein
MKSHSAAIKPTMDMDTSAKMINTQTDIKVAELEEMTYRDVHFRYKRWSQLPTAPYTVTNAQGILNKMMSRIPFYEAKMVDVRIFQVFYIGPPGLENMKLNELSKEDMSLDRTIPVCSRIRTVSVDSQGAMICTCCLFERQGLPCTHQACVTDLCHKSLGRSFAGFTHHDVHERWRSDYMHYAYENSTHPDMYMKYHCITIK